MTPVVEHTSEGPSTSPNSWRDLIQSNEDAAAIEGLALEQLIDFQRASKGAFGQEKKS